VHPSNLLLLSPEAWGANKVSKHHYAGLLAEQGHQVYFINPPIYTLPERVRLEKVQQGLTIVHYKPFLRGTNRLPQKVKNFLQRLTIKQLLRSINQPIDVVWSFDPFRFQNLRQFKAQLHIYHPVDIHYTDLEFEIANSADVIFATAQKILDKFTGIDTPQYVINHGLAQHFVEPNKQEIDFHPTTSFVSVGYVGNLQYQYIDWPRLLEIVQQNSTVQFYFIGPYEGSNLSTKAANQTFIEQLQALPNTHLLGSKPSEQLPLYLHKMDAFLMCYTGDVNPAAMANPHKILEYLSTGKVVVCHYIDEYRDKRELLEMVDNNTQLAERFQTVIKQLNTYNSSELQDRRRTFAFANTYEQQLQKIESIFTTI